MNASLEEKKEELENALDMLKDHQEIRIRAEGQYESALESLKKLGFDSIPEATKDYKASYKKLEEDVTVLLKDIEVFMEGFNEAFGDL